MSTENADMDNLDDR